MACISFLAFLAARVPAAAQDVPRQVEVDPVLLNDISPDMESAQERRRDRDRAEDLAILSQIFYEDLARLYRQATSATSAAVDSNLPYDEMVRHFFLGDRAAAEEIGAPLADYLPGYGVVVQVHAPSPQRPSAAELKRDVTALSRWEATRLRMRGEALYDAAACAACHDTQTRAEVNHLWWSFFDQDRDPHRGLGVMPETARRRPTEELLITALVDVLSEAGGQLRHIQPDERITLCVQFAPEVQTPSDEEFLRRVYLDLLGQLPTPEEVQSFLDDASADKRAKLIDRLSQRVGPGTGQDRGRNDRSVGSSKDTDERHAAAPRESGKNALEELIKHRLSRKAPTAGSEAPLRGRISVTATKRQIDALAAGALERSDFAKQVVVRSFDPRGVPSEIGRGR
jgi:hypothetical protein